MSAELKIAVDHQARVDIAGLKADMTSNSKRIDGMEVKLETLINKLDDIKTVMIQLPGELAIKIDAKLDDFRNQEITPISEYQTRQKGALGMARAAAPYVAAGGIGGFIAKYFPLFGPLVGK